MTKTLTKAFRMFSLVLALALGGVIAAGSGSAQAGESVQLAKQQPNSECLNGLNGCKAMCFGKDNRRRGQCLAACNVDYRRCKASSGT
ncbi:hypothetical protein A7A08_02575 [Methyloligella halotolerans]|uniref:Uncharacterized protein n=1 Tax=Methyloligella halotolerans TaxID=1177755 RepID=A0A1E2RWB9_9HYPH|nr:hypothetical protein [Methyloligella halotolerans]ODA66452.1 hypothetical protein A7A08_02575 [Methyloligella halotolerans]